MVEAGQLHPAACEGVGPMKRNDAMRGAHGDSCESAYLPPASPRRARPSLHSLVRGIGGLVAYVAAMAALTAGMLWLLWKVQGR